MIRRIFFGFKVEELKHVMGIIEKISATTVNKEDWGRVNRLYKRNLYIKLASLPLAASLGYFFPLGSLGSPEIIRLFLGLFGYRLITVPANHALFTRVAEIWATYEQKS